MAYWYQTEPQRCVRLGLIPVRHRRIVRQFAVLGAVLDGDAQRVAERHRVRDVPAVRRHAPQRIVLYNQSRVGAGVRALVEVPAAVEVVFGPGSLTTALSVHRVDLVSFEEREILRVALRVEGDADEGTAAARSQNGCGARAAV